ncbi:MAG: MFS transporter [Phycisphaeraceae bacterium]
MLQAIQRQFLITFASMGAVLAYLPVFLEERLASKAQVGWVMSTTGLAIILTPVVMTALADTKLQSRSIIAALFCVSSLTCFWQAVSEGFVGLLVSHTAFAFCFWPLAALQDGLVFADNQQARTEGRRETPYHRVRVFGTVGFALPLAALYFLINAGLDVSSALYVGGGVCALGAVNALTLPRTALGQARRARYQAAEHDDLAPADRFPTRAAARVLFRGTPLIFCACLLVAHLGNSAYYAFYPIYLTRQVGFDNAWVGPITMLGVVLELAVMTSVGLMLRRLGLKRLLLVGLGVMVVRFALLGLWPVQHVAVWTQILHGITVVGIYVVPPIYLNTLASDHFRSSIHGLYAMVVFGPGRILGNVLGGELADVSLPILFNISAATTLLAVIGLALAMRLPKQVVEHAEDVPAMVEGD